MNVGDWSRENLERYGEYDTVVAAGTVWTSRTVHEKASHLAAALIDRGVAPGDRVLLLLPNCVELIIGFTAALRCGAVAVPMFARAASAEAQGVLAHCGAAVVVTTRSIAREMRLSGQAMLTIVTGPGDGPDGAVEFERLIEEGGPLDVSVPRADDDPAYICYTSGTTGAPKGVVFTHGSVRIRHPRIEPPPVDTVLAALPLHTFGASALTARLAYPWTLILLDRLDPRSMLSAIEEHAVTSVALVPSMAEALIAVPELAVYDLSSLRRVTLSGAHVSSATLERLQAALPVTPVVAYGMTEAGGGIAATSPSSKRGSVGRPLPSVEVRIVGDDGSERPRSEIGEIHVRTPRIAAGYFDQYASGASFASDGWLRTGDLGYLDDEANLFIVGRSKDVIIQAGVNVLPGEVTEVILQMPQVQECAVVGTPHPFLGEQVTACVVTRPGTSLDSDGIVRACRTHLDVRKAPVRVRFFGELPKTPSGKLDGPALRRQLDAQESVVVETELLRRLASASSSAREAMIADAIERAVRTIVRGGPAGGEDALGWDVTFGDLGLDSLQIADLGNRVSDALGRRISPVLAFGYPTIAALARQLARELVPSIETPSTSTPRSASVREPIAIIGFGCRLPGGVRTPEEFWNLLHYGVDASAEIVRWDMSDLYDPHRRPGKSRTRRAALLDRVELFDAAFFSMSRHEAEAIGVQHRLALEVTWEALEDAGYDPFALSEPPTGLFLGMMGTSRDVGGPAGAQSMAVGRICHFLDLRGPAVLIDTACSSSLVAVHAAAQALRADECAMAIAGGVHVIGSPQSFVALSQLDLMAADGRSKAFDADADGFGRGEGVVMIVLKRLSDARRARDRIIAVIRGSAVGHDGRSSSLTAPNGRAQAAVIRRALADAGLEPADVDYLEAHGTGTPLGDPIELQAASAVFGERSRPLVVGSVKTNIGHLEAAAGAAGLMKTALALQHAEVPAHLHLRRRNPLLESLAGRFVIPLQRQAWPATPGRRAAAGVTSLGISGTNAHVVLEEAAAEPDGRGGISAEGPTPLARERLICVSARSAEGLRAQAARYAHHFARVADAAMPDHCFTANAGRTHFAHRLAILAESPAAAADRFVGFATGDHRSLAHGIADRRPKIAFLFTGNGSQYAGMGMSLYRSEDGFRRALDQCAEILNPALGRSLIDVLSAVRAQKPGELTLSDAAAAQPALFAVQWALCEMWREWGIEPDVVLGHSVGEYAAACVGGFLDITDGLRFIVERGRLMQRLAGGGAMFSVAASVERVRAAIDRTSSIVSLAAVNAPRSVVISGDEAAAATVAAALAREGAAVRRLDVSRAYHSSLVEPILDELAAAAARVSWRPPRVPLVSTLTGAFADRDDLADPQYWRRHAREPVMFAAAMRQLVQDGIDIALEIGPDPVMIGMAQEWVDGPLTWVPTLRRERNDGEQVAAALAEMYVHGLTPAWASFYARRDRRRVALPTYPFERAECSDLRAAVSRSIHVQSHPDIESAARTGSPLVVPSASDRPNVTPAARLESLTESVRQALIQACDRVPLSIAPDQNLLELGLDSLRVLDIVGAIRRMTDVSCTPADFLSRPTLSAFTAYLDSVLSGNGEHGAAPAATDGARRAPAQPSSPLVALNKGGTRTPLICIHPSGGQITPYLRLGNLLSDDQPLLAIQSRALVRPEIEHRHLRAMAVDYATVVESACDGRPVQLLGWSFGGTVAWAVASELERRGVAVRTVWLIDPVDATAARSAGARVGVEFGFAAIVHETVPSPPPLNELLARLRAARASRRRPRWLLAWAEEQGLIPVGQLSEETLKARLALYRRHFELLRHRPAPIHCPVRVWWASPGHRFDYPAGMAAHVREVEVGGTHFSIMRPPHIEQIAAAIAARDELH